MARPTKPRPQFVDRICPHHGAITEADARWNGHYWVCGICARSWTQTSRRRKRLRVLEHYGAFCHCPGCGVTEEAFLVIDHVDDNGNDHRREISKSFREGGRGGAGWQTYQWLIDNDFPPGFQVLCANCNTAKMRPEGCPHQRKAGG